MAIDPGNDTGWCYSTRGIITGCGLTQPHRLTPVSYASVIVECPQVYPHNRTVDPNDLIKLAIKVGCVQQFYETLGCKVSLVFPREWKGQVPKEICENRTRVALYYPNEVLLVEDALAKVPTGKQHNVWDAIALNLWFMKREKIRP